MSTTDMLAGVLAIVLLGQMYCGGAPFKVLVNGEVVTISAVPK